MNRRTFALILGLGAALAMAPVVVFAEDHLAEAIKHTKEAIDHGKMGHADVLTTHAEAALQHAEAAEKANHHPDIDIRWNKVHLALSSHDAGGLTSRDFGLAAAIDGLV